MTGITTSPETSQSLLQGTKEDKSRKGNRSQSPECKLKSLELTIVLEDFLIMREKNQSWAFERLIWQQCRGQTGGKSQPKGRKTSDYCNSPGMEGC